MKKYKYITSFMHYFKPLRESSLPYFTQWSLACDHLSYDARDKKYYLADKIAETELIEAIARKANK